VAAAPKPVARKNAPAGPDVDDEAAWEAVAAELEELGESGGKAAAGVRAFVAVFPPAAVGGEPWGDGAVEEELPAFRPRAASYAAALREVLAGRRRARIAGRWANGGEGTLTVGLIASDWTVLGSEGL